jgi:ankyrin repeat protein
VGATPLHYAANAGSIDVIQSLLRNGASPRRTTPCYGGRGNKGSLFVLVPEPEPDDPELEALLQPPPPPPPADPSALTKDPVLICPAQFGTQADYQELVDELQARGHPVMVAPVVFTDWLRLIPAALTPDVEERATGPGIGVNVHVT